MKNKWLNQFVLLFKHNGPKEEQGSNDVQTFRVSIVGYMIV